MPGWDAATKEITRKFAHFGYAAICPHLFHRDGGEGVSPEDAAAAARATGGISDELFVGDMAGAIEYLRSQAYTTDKVGAIGYCSGGRQAYIAAANLPLNAAVSCYGGRIVVAEENLDPGHPVAPIAMTKDISCPILCLFGAEDANPSPADREVIEKALTEHGKSFECVTYENAGHSFFSVDRPAYRVEAANAGWAKVFEFLGMHLGSQA
jgi:carboxymethylenebutenolidase